MVGNSNKKVRSIALNVFVAMMLIFVIALIGFFAMKKTDCKEGEAQVRVLSNENPVQIPIDSLRPLRRAQDLQYRDRLVDLMDARQSGNTGAIPVDSLSPLRRTQDLQYRNKLVDLMDAQQLENNLMYAAKLSVFCLLLLLIQIT